ncbi:MAG: 4-hydroxy-tetrahydrodipicolinate synthase [Pyrinomonadaceae bacterium]
MTTKIDWLSGCATALVTPFKKNGAVDEECFYRLCERQVKNGVKILIPSGTTGESVTLSFEEKIRVVEIAVEVAAKLEAKVIAGTGNNCTSETIELTREVRRVGADAALVVGPYYNKPTQEGYFQHFREIAASVSSFPIVLYNVPGRTASNITAETQLRIANEIPSVVATKEASGNLVQIMKIIDSKPKNFRVFSGDDAITLPLIAAGADGLISVISNEFPKEVSTMVNKALAGSLTAARKIHYKFLNLMEANFIEANPAPCKFVMKEMGLLDDKVRLPLVPVSKDTGKQLSAILQELI